MRLAINHLATANLLFLSLSALGLIMQKGKAIALSALGLIMQKGKAIALLRLPAADKGEAAKPKRQPRASRRNSMRQATNIIEAVRFAKSINLPLVAHLTIHWSLTDAGDDPYGKLFAKVREGLDKWLHRRGIVFAGAWAREREARGQSEVEHCHLLFHLPVQYRTGKKLRQVEAAIARLVKRHGRDITDERVIKLVIHDNPDGKYLIKGGGPKIWKRFGLRKKDRRLQGLLCGKRCGVTENIGLAARKRWREQQNSMERKAA